MSFQRVSCSWKSRRQLQYSYYSGFAGDVIHPSQSERRDLSHEPEVISPLKEGVEASVAEERAPIHVQLESGLSVGLQKREVFLSGTESHVWRKSRPAGPDPAEDFARQEAEAGRPTARCSCLRSPDTSWTSDGMPP
ncbi:hypothetical protein AOLI_G00320180 [Acnodon oligacanthus]